MKIMIKLNVIIKLDENYHDTDILFESWKRRKLTLFEKSIVINSLVLSNSR